MDEAHGAEERLEAALKAVRDALPHATPRQRALLFKRGGDICVGLDERRKALPWYGRAIDQLLELGEGEEAARMCRLIIFVQPDAVRARGTLTWISIGMGDQEAAAEHLAAYTQAARQAGQIGLAAQQLSWMYEVATSQSLRERIAMEMRTLGDAQRAAAMTARLHAPPPQPVERELLWARVLDATIGAAARQARTAR